MDSTDRTSKNNFDYKTVVYLDLPDNKVIKIFLTGFSQSNWFDYTGAVKDSLPTRITVFEIKKDEKNGTFQAVMSKGEEKTDVNENFTRAETLLNMTSTQPALPEGQDKGPENEGESEEIPTIDVEEDPNEIKPENIPF